MTRKAVQGEWQGRGTGGVGQGEGYRGSGTGEGDRGRGTGEDRGRGTGEGGQGSGTGSHSNFRRVQLKGRHTNLGKCKLHVLGDSGSVKLLCDLGELQGGLS